MIPKRILLIDDEDDIREIAQLSLEMMGVGRLFWQIQDVKGLKKLKLMNRM